jgi:putative N6-adenine-specific DNA methylase
VEKENFTVLAKTLAGLEEVLAEELIGLGVKNPVIGNRAVTFRADTALLYRINLWSRLALRFFRLISTFTIKEPKDLYNGVAQTNWWKWIGVDQTFRIDNTISSQLFNSPLYASQLAKDAIVDQFRARFNKRPSVDKENPDYTLLLAIRGQECWLYLDSSGEALFKRGYRLRTVTAPINEVLAAGILKLSGWTPDIPLIDPMCGSGTFPVEAALMGMNIPPGFNRDFFAFMNWPDFDRYEWKKLKAEVFKQQLDTELEIYGYDISESNLDIARDNINQLRMHKDIQLAQADFLQLTPPVERGVLVINPPYGERLRKVNVNDLYQNIGNTLKHRFAGFEAWIISSDLDAMKNIGLKPYRKLTLYNGNLECRLHAFRMF